jgi:CRP-like cAMP-binding protein
MLEKIREVLSQFVFLSPKDILQLASIVKLKSLKKGDYFVREGDLNYNSAKVISGLLAHYVIDKNGEVKTLLFVPEKRYSGSLQTTLNNQPADENIVALEDSLLLICDVRSLDSLAKENIRIQRLMAHSYKDIITEAAARIKFLIAHSEEERYLNFIMTYPNLEKRVKQKDLATFLGVTPSSLSRIKARVNQEKTGTIQVEMSKRTRNE